MFKSTLGSIRQFLVDESGPTAVEYLFMMSAIIFVVVGTVSVIGSHTEQLFLKTKNKLP